jgi:hypothetical protein
MIIIGHDSALYAAPNSLGVMTKINNGRTTGEKIECFLLAAIAPEPVESLLFNHRELSGCLASSSSWLRISCFASRHDLGKMIGLQDKQSARA